MVPEQWFLDYMSENRYCMVSMADYIAFRQARGDEYSPSDRIEISLEVAA